MSNEIEIFNNTQFGNIRVQKDEDGEPLFCLADVCRALEIDRTDNVAKQVCDEFELPLLKRGSYIENRCDLLLAQKRATNNP